VTAALKVPIDGGPYALAIGPDGAPWVALEAGFRAADARLRRRRDDFWTPVSAL
jgi:hypothetical protein